MVLGVYTVILIGSFLFLMWKKEDAELYFPLKIIGYFILGSFALNFNQISFPLGFIVYLLFFRPRLNGQVKRIAAILGVFTFILVHWVIPYVVEEWENRPQFIEREIGLVYTINFQDEYDELKQGLKLENTNLRLEDFELEYTEDGKITDLRWQLIIQNGKGYNLYKIHYDYDKSSYRVTTNQVDTWLQYERLVDADFYFENLNALDIKDITHDKGNFPSYVIQSTGEQVNYAIKNRTKFVLSNEEMQLLDDEKLPIEGYYISIFAMEKTGEERDDQGNITQVSFQGTEVSDYLFGVNMNN